MEMNRRQLFKGLFGLAATLALGGSQAVRQQTVNLPIAGSTPALPASRRVLPIHSITFESPAIVNGVFYPAGTVQEFATKPLTIDMLRKISKQLNESVHA
jgi:hypothetical protein